MVENLTFNLSNFHQQEFLFPLKLINYVNKEADAEIKQKLDRSCKYFYKELPYLIIDSLEISEAKQRLENETYGGCIDFTDDDELQAFMNKNNRIWITTKINLFIRHELDAKFGDKIIRCDASEVSVFDANLAFNDFELLTKSGKVEYLDMSASSIVDDYGSVPLEDVLALVPNARIIRMLDCHVTNKTMKKLLAIIWKQKIIELNFNNIDGPLDAKLFFKFIKKFVHHEAHMQVSFTFENKTFGKAYNKKVSKSGENLPIFGTMDTPVKKKKTWMKRCLQIIRRKFAPTKEVSKLDEELSPPKKITYNDENAERQYTAFPYPHMCYIRENANAEIWKKLERTCKFFCQKNPYLIVDDFHIGTDDKITLTVDNNKIMFVNREEMDKIDKLLWITNSIDNVGTGGLYMQDRIDAVKISIGSFIYSSNHFKWLTKSGKVKDWNSIEGLIKNNDLSKVISLNEFLVHLPNVEIFRAGVRGIHSCYPNKTISLPQSNKLKYLEIIFLEDSIQADSLFDVLKTSLAAKAVVKIDLSDLIEHMDIEEFKAQMKSLFGKWKPEIEKPTFKIIS